MHILTTIFLLSAASAATATATTTLPPPPPGSDPSVAQLISQIPTCWTGCVASAIASQCPLDDTWTCVCGLYFSPADDDFIGVATADGACAQCSVDVGPSDDAGEQNISGLLVNICLDIPGGGTSAGTATAAGSGGPTAVSSSSPHPAKNAAVGSGVASWRGLGAVCAVCAVCAVLGGMIMS